MLVSTYSFQIPKEDRNPESIEDALSIWPRPDPSGKLESAAVQAVVTDGAARSYLADVWARCLAEGFASIDLGRGRIGNCIKAMEAAQENWRRTVAAYLAARAKDGPPLKWWEDNGLQEGAGATLISVRLSKERKSSTSGAWLGLSVGDCCLFQVRDGVLLDAFPFRSSTRFNSSPDLLSSRAPVDIEAKHIQRRTGRWREGDSFYLASDAVAEWLLRCAERDESEWQQFRPGRVVGTDSLNGLIGELRAARKIKNDDSSVISLYLDPRR